MPYERLNPNAVNLEHLVRCMDMAFAACSKFRPKPKSSDEMPETDEERVDRKHRESGQDRNLPPVPFEDPHDTAKYHEELEPIPETLEEEQHGCF